MRTSFLLIVSPIPQLPAAREYLQLEDRSWQHTLMRRFGAILGAPEPVRPINAVVINDLQGEIQTVLQELLNEGATPTAFVVGVDLANSDVERGVISFQVSMAGFVQSIAADGAISVQAPRASQEVFPWVNPHHDAVSAVDRGPSPFGMPPTRPPVGYESAWEWATAQMQARRGAFHRNALVGPTAEDFGVDTRAVERAGTRAMLAEMMSMGDVDTTRDSRGVSVEYESSLPWLQTEVPFSDSSGAPAAKDIVPTTVTTHGLRGEDIGIEEQMTAALFETTGFELTENELRPDRTAEWAHESHFGWAAVPLHGEVEQMGFLVRPVVSLMHGELEMSVLDVLLYMPCEEHGFHVAARCRYVVPKVVAGFYGLSATMTYILERRGDDRETSAAFERLYEYLWYHGEDKVREVQDLTTSPPVYLPPTPMAPWRFEHKDLVAEVIPVAGGGFYFHREG